MEAGIPTARAVTLFFYRNTRFPCLPLGKVLGISPRLANALSKFQLFGVGVRGRKAAPPGHQPGFR
ncbi:hypothetical protein Deipe_0989 [Deinococcus peraridilitoris DSM 19664]|uniref:Uncharacterized protein n=1 Tax=Deinococcus peraridilitoris (strain DSM 19664 / LMG 22246 / CIP 109416 / KR-200) TaxID=937777 RepID=K9ZY11_DEIPD|nr:hypothetical protein Deipe_0989 [Deinococcus peraridilitoris DSM 19664]